MHKTVSKVLKIFRKIVQFLWGGARPPSGYATGTLENFAYLT